LTGEYETQSIDKFSWGVSDRGASIRVPQSTAEHWTGYLEDRRPGSNADPYKIIYQINKSINDSETIGGIKHKMNYKLDMDNLMMDYNTLSPEELLSEYRNDEEDEVNQETEVIKFDTESLIKSSSLPSEIKKAMMNSKNINLNNK
jgi:glutamine synthetase